MNELNRIPSAPGVHRKQPSTVKAVFKSIGDFTETITVTLTMAFGVIMAGMVLAINRSRAGNRGQAVPYVPRIRNVMNPDHMLGLAPLFADVAADGKVVRMMSGMAKRFTAGDDMVLEADNLPPAFMGAITGIVHQGEFADITGSFPAGDAYTTANHASVRVMTGWVADLEADVAETATSVSIAKTAFDPAFVKPGEPVCVADTDNGGGSASAAISWIEDAGTTMTLHLTSQIGTAATTANGGVIFIQGCNHADGILPEERSATTAPGMGGMVWARATAKAPSLPNLDAAAVRDMGGRRQGRLDLVI